MEKIHQQLKEDGEINNNNNMAPNEINTMLKKQSQYDY